MHDYYIVDLESGEAVPDVQVIYKDEGDNLISKHQANELDVCGKYYKYVEIISRGYITKRLEINDFQGRINLIQDKPYVYTESLSSPPGGDIAVSWYSSRPVEAYLVPLHGSRIGERIPLASLLRSTPKIPDGDVVASGLNWPSISLVIPQVECGLYSLNIGFAGSLSMAPLVVKNTSEQPKNEILLVSSFATWACYNYWGGRSRYRAISSTTSKNGLRVMASRFFSALFSEITKEKIKRAIKKERVYDSWIYQSLSLHRPWGKYLGLDIHPYEASLNHLAALDIKIIHWFEVAGFSFDLIPDLDVATALSGDDYKAVVLLGHSEYWSDGMFDALSNSNKKGAWILNLSGNSIYRRIHVNKDSIQLADLLFCFGGRDESKVTGVRYSERAYGTAAPYRVTDPDHWVFSGLHLKKGDEIGKKCLLANDHKTFSCYRPDRPTTKDCQLIGSGASGFEVDTITKNGRSYFSVIAKGTQKHGAEMAIKEASDGYGGVFSASSINFGGALLVDYAISGIVKNVLLRAISQHE